VYASKCECDKAAERMWEQAIKLLDLYKIVEAVNEIHHDQMADEIQKELCPGGHK
jgi:hypothetical protein